MSAVTPASVNIAIKALCAGEDASREVRRRIFKAVTVADLDVDAINILINEALAQLVNARASLNGTTAVEAL